ncbi:23S rRNA (uracil(1939)-C(5))-methyltransferase RlmD [Robiginitalea sp. IMCC43444]|uniref:23S rRNA (uracil(1939)-C(5))-methyltransferase RlmD n=1 Tax=Robiginitalea sp. IMCC43444 TaxID=3459121 RepID=UPI004042CE20
MRKKNNRKIFEEVEVLRAGAKGKSIAQAPDGRVIFLSNAVPGDVVRVQTTRKRRAYYEGVATDILSPSKDRINPECIHFGTCGGCKWQHMAYSAQLQHKQEEVLSNLQRIGKVTIGKVYPILAAPSPYFYRNKMEFSFSNNRWLDSSEIESQKAVEDKNALGLHIPGMWDKVLDLKECHLQAAPSNAIRLGIRAYATEHGLSFFDPKKQKGLLRTLMIRNTTAGAVMVLLQFFEDRKEQREGLLEYLRDSFPQIESLYYVINTKANDTLYDQELHCYAGEPYITEQMEDLQFRITPKSFYQTNSEQAYNLYKKVREFANLQGSELVYDLYTGLGTIAQFIARQADRVIGIEAVPEAVEAAKMNAKDNGIDNIAFYAGDMKELFTDDFLNEHGHPDLIITDPPRDGMHKQVVEQILKIAPEKIVYVSCNSATQARDLALMSEQYELVCSQAVDMFPQTQHVENIVLLKARSNT